MAIRSIGWLTAGMLAGSLLVGVPSLASKDDSSSSPASSPMMTGTERQMMKQMSRMMKDPDMRREMVSMMSQVMSEMGPGMGRMGPMGRMDLRDMS